MKRLAYEPAVEGPDMLRLYLKDISKYPQLTPAEEHDLGVLARSGDQNALRRMVESNLRFVVSLAKKYSRSGFPMHELINVGNMGLTHFLSKMRSTTHQRHRTVDDESRVEVLIRRPGRQRKSVARLLIRP